MENLAYSTPVVPNSRPSEYKKKVNHTFCSEISGEMGEYENSHLKYLEQRIDLLDTEFSEVRRKCDKLSNQNEILILQNKKLQSQYSVLNSKVENLMKKNPSKSVCVCVDVGVIKKRDVNKVSILNMLV